VRLITRDGNDFTRRFPFIEMAVKSLPVRSCLIDGALVFNAACQLGCEGRLGRSSHWLKLKNPKAAAVMREPKEDWVRS
jgi:hypothetical protein